MTLIQKYGVIKMRIGMQNQESNSRQGYSIIAVDDEEGIID